MKTELTWAAGLYEGEGSFGAYPYPRACVVSTDEDVIVRFADAVGIGKIGNPRVRLSAIGNKPQYEWKVQTLEGTQYLACLLWSYLGIRRREQIRSALQRYKDEVKPKSGNTLAEQWFGVRYRDLDIQQRKAYHSRHKRKS